MKRMSYYIIGLLLSLMSWSCSDDAETGREEIPVETYGISGKKFINILIFRVDISGTGWIRAY